MSDSETTHEPSRPPVREMNAMAIASFVVSLVGLCNPLGILGLIFGYVAKRQIRDRGNAGGGLATAGIVLGWVSLIGFILLIVFAAAGAFGSWLGWVNDHNN
ncbi:MAG TPA: DUF4190 domain-containing protein [Stackebrandtia sp.]|jgi:hypothetical protein|uniref:DUF4190 domain-containing protein n=1 Tax=Stackebrandtia sp. TaxID=2023065 RepID=UPI002D435E47|nr:DUF4190 domain-containing protein [Stackebrandtia sp.]HZE39285.1 DUF4190 domain-containing protein [Stackebrandtia sp.]